MKNITLQELREALADIPLDLETMETRDGWYLVWRRGDLVISAHIMTLPVAAEDELEADEDDGA